MLILTAAVFAMACGDGGGGNGGNGDDRMDVGVDGGGEDALAGDVSETEDGGDAQGSAEVCDDGADNDGDGDIDCRDEECDGESSCLFSALAAGRLHACGVLQSGRVACWGWNADGQIGNGESGSEAVGPTLVEGLDKILDVAVGMGHSCARRSGGRVYCWGNNESGQLGDDSFVTSPFPVQVVELTGVVDLSAGGDHTCAVNSDRGTSRVYCWGANNRYQVGVPSNVTTRRPVEITSNTLGSLTGFEEVASGLVHNCAWKPDADGKGPVLCWGDSQKGQHGINNDGLERSIPMRYVRLKSNNRQISDFVAEGLAAGQNSTCAIRDGGSVWCWGDGSQGHFGSESLAEVQQGAVEFPGLGDADRLWHELFHVCAERTSGRVACWGDNSQFAFTDESGGYLNPVLLHDLVEPNDVAAGYLFTCWADAEGRAYCQGASNTGQLGSPSLTDATATPQRVLPEY
jgi:alpha-tubulin suppressor-like RCC1 family protein